MAVFAQQPLQRSWYGTTPFKALQQIAFSQLLWNGNAGKWHFIAGLPLRFTFYDDNTPGTRNTNGLNSPQRTWLPGLFGQAEWAPNQSTTFLGGGRYDYHSVHGHVLSGRLSLKYKAADWVTLRLTGGNGYRVVNLFTEDHAALSGSREVLVTEALKPERSWNINANAQAFANIPFGILTLDLSVFYTRFANKIIGDFMTDPNTIYYQNLKGFAVSRGVTANADAAFENGLKLMAGVTWLDVFSMEEEIRIGQLYAPSLSGTFSASYVFGAIGLGIDYTGQVTGPMHLPVLPNDYRPAQSPWYSLQNIQLTKTCGSRGKAKWEIYGGVKNIFNFMPRNPLMRPFDPFDRSVDVNNPNGYTFDASYNYAPLQGRRLFVGVRYKLP